jgi:hypothetical protein
MEKKDKVIIGPTIKCPDGIFTDCLGNILEDDAILVIKGRKELAVTVNDKELEEIIRIHLSSYLLPPLKYLTNFLDNRKVGYEIRDTSKAIKI